MHAFRYRRHATLAGCDHNGGVISSEAAGFGAQITATVTAQLRTCLTDRQLTAKRPNMETSGTRSGCGRTMQGCDESWPQPFWPSCPARPW